MVHAAVLFCFWFGVGLEDGHVPTDFRASTVTGTATEKWENKARTRATYVHL